jgi:hypothetical protein
MQPGREGRVAAVRAETLPHAHERLLGELVGLGAVARHAQAQRVDASDVLAR